MKLLFLLCLVGSTVSLNRKQLVGMKRLLKKMDAGVYPTCKLVFFSEQVDFETAEKNCENFNMGMASNQKGNLATVNNEEKNKDLKLLLEIAYPLDPKDKDKWGPDKWVWAGLRKTKNNGINGNVNKKYNPDDWAWADGKNPTDFQQWFNKKQPDQRRHKKGEGQCQEDPFCFQNQMRINHHGKWDDTFKFKKHPYACDYQGKYILSATPRHWQAAKKACETAGMHLAKVRNIEELEEIKQAAGYFLGPREKGSREFDSNNWYWIGGTDANQEGEWVWEVDGEKIDTKWMPWRSPNPDDAKIIGKTGQDALSISKWGLFDDSYISKKRLRPFACQCPDS